MELERISVAPPWARICALDIDTDPLDALPAEAIEVLSPILATHTATPDRIMFCLWEGYPEVKDDLALIPDEWLVSLAGRRYTLYTGALDSWLRLAQLEVAIGLVWPADRSWFFGTDVDYAWAYMGASAECIRELMTLDSIEAFLTTWDAPSRFGMDELNH
ncbi:MAG: hypothetical protein ACLPQS_10410 [Acidimicrobiales bacterium]